jgi:hypothetical protein
VRGPSNMSDKPTLSLFYPGSATPGSMEARELLQVLTAFTRITNKASRTYHGSNARISIRIERVQPGSVDLQWLHEIAATAQSTFSAFPGLLLGIKDVPSLIKAWLDLLKFLRGQPPQRVTRVSAKSFRHRVRLTVLGPFWMLFSPQPDPEPLLSFVSHSAKRVK